MAAASAAVARLVALAPVAVRELFSGSGKQTVIEFIAFCKAGSFVIG